MKTILSKNLCLLLLFICSQRVQALTTPELTIGETDALKADARDILGDGGSVSYDAASKTLTLHNANVGEIYAALTVHTIRLIGQNCVTGNISINEPGSTNFVITGNSVRDRLILRSEPWGCGISVSSTFDLIDENTPTYPDLTIANCYIRASYKAHIHGRSLLTIRNAYVECTGDNNFWGFSQLVLDEGVTISTPANARYDETLQTITVDGKKQYQGRVVIDARKENGEAISENAIAIHQIDGAIITYAFEDKPVISYTGEELVITTSSTSVQYPLAYLRKLTLESDWNTATAIDDVTFPDTEFSFSDEGAKVRGEKPGTPFYVFDLKGSKVYQGVIDAEGRASIPLHTLPQGIYVVKTQSTSFKVKR